MKNNTIEKQVIHKAELKGQDLLAISKDSNGFFELTAMACSECLELLRDYKKHNSDFRLWSEPQGSHHSEVLLRELIQKFHGRWRYPFEHSEICHCRNVSTEKVDQAIIAGASTSEKVSRLTSASTACGTCRTDVENLIRFRLGKK
jgi:bacterioferritin-associated ferredoxin